MKKGAAIGLGTAAAVLLLAITGDRDPAIPEPPSTQPEPQGGPPEVDAFIRARHYTPTGTRDVRWIVLHSTENDIQPGMARAVAHYFAGQSPTSGPRSSAHYVVDAGEVVQTCALGDVAWAAPGANRAGVQVEMVGRAASTDWLGDGLPVLERTAALVAGLCRHLGIARRRLDPVALVSSELLGAGDTGITTHWSTAEAARLARARGLRMEPWFRNGKWVHSDHADPGLAHDARFPWDAFLDLVRGSHVVV